MYTLKQRVIIGVTAFLVASFMLYCGATTLYAAGSQGAVTDVYYDAYGNQYTYATYTWGDSTEVTAEISLPYETSEPDLMWFQWDTAATAGDQAYDDNEDCWVDISTWTRSSAIATDSRSVISIVREEFATNDGAEDGVIAELIFFHRRSG